MWENEVLVGDLMRETVNSVAGGWWEETHPARHRIPIVGRRVVAPGITRQLVRQGLQGLGGLPVEHPLRRLLLGVDLQRWRQLALW